MHRSEPLCTDFKQRRLLNVYIRSMKAGLWFDFFTRQFKFNFSNFFLRILSSVSVCELNPHKKIPRCMEIEANQVYRLSKEKQSRDILMANVSKHRNCVVVYSIPHKASSQSVSPNGVGRTKCYGVSWSFYRPVRAAFFCQFGKCIYLSARSFLSSPYPPSASWSDFFREY